jgi:hypothetical protein
MFDERTLTGIEKAVLSAVALNAFGARFGRCSELRNVIENHRECQEAADLSDSEIEMVIDRLRDAGLVIVETIRGKIVGYTEDAVRCGLYDPCGY